jgi:hypothetical protein
MTGKTIIIVILTFLATLMTVYLCFVPKKPNDGFNYYKTNHHVIHLDDYQFECLIQALREEKR